MRAYSFRGREGSLQGRGGEVGAVRSGPIFPFEPPDCWCLRVLDLKPMRRPARYEEPSRFDTTPLQPSAGVLLDRGAIAGEMFIDSNAVVGAPQQLTEPALAVRDRIAPNVLALHLEQIERAHDHHLHGELQFAGGELSNKVPRSGTAISLPRASVSPVLFSTRQETRRA